MRLEIFCYILILATNVQSEHQLDIIGDNQYLDFKSMPSNIEVNISKYIKTYDSKPPKRQSEDNYENIFSILLKPDDEKPTKRPTTSQATPRSTLSSKSTNSSRSNKPTPNMRDLENEDNSTLSYNITFTNPPTRPTRPERPDGNSNIDSVRPIKPDFDNQYKPTKKPTIVDLELNSEFSMDYPSPRSLHNSALTSSRPLISIGIFCLFINMIIKFSPFL